MLYKACLIKPDTSIKSAMFVMNQIGRKELFVVGSGDRLEGSLSDGDIRKWILRDGRLDISVWEICNRTPKSLPQNYDIEQVKSLMLEQHIESIPIVDNKSSVLDVLIWDKVFDGQGKSFFKNVDIPVVVMAGGKGTRLDPFTKILPKPLIPINDKPIIEIILDRLSAQGMKNFFLILNYKAAMIKSYFEEVDTDCQITFIEEKDFLGTAGGLSLLPKTMPDTFLITNCDVIIDADYTDLLKFHRENRFVLTAIVSCRNFTVPYGVCEIENGGVLKGMREKPEYNFLVNTGVYLMDKKLISLFPAGLSCQMNELIELALGQGLRVGAYPIQEKHWIDIGQWDEFHKAIKLLGA